ncbi:MAG TPA: hypothetical protein V6D10_07425 [Trichocoleus sp.]|jgi:integrase
MKYTLEAVNQRLKESRVRVSLRQKGGTIALVATLPPKPGSDRPKPFQQEVYLGIPASENGFKRAENEARLLGAKLVTNQFDWGLYLKDDRIAELQSAGVLIQRFKDYYTQRNSISEATWKNHWWKIYKRLPPNEPLTIDRLIALVEATERDSRNRLETCRKLQHLADFAKLEINLLQLKGSYGPSKVEPRCIPTDAEIEYWWKQIPNADWKWVYGAIAAFGLRPHEAFFCKWNDEGLYVLKGKTGERLVFTAVYPEWVDAWNLREILRPDIDFEASYADQKLGSKITRQLRRYGVPFTAYDLRHAHSLRISVQFRYPPTTAAALLGHSPEMHYRTYQRHVSRQQNLEISQRIINDPNRPKPPSASLAADPGASGN